MGNAFDLSLSGTNLGVIALLTIYSWLWGSLSQMKSFRCMNTIFLWFYLNVSKVKNISAQLSKWCHFTLNSNLLSFQNECRKRSFSTPLPVEPWTSQRSLHQKPSLEIRCSTLHLLCVFFKSGGSFFLFS